MRMPNCSARWRIGRYVLGALAKLKVSFFLCLFLLKKRSTRPMASVLLGSRFCVPFDICTSTRTKSSNLFVFFSLVDTLSIKALN